VIRFYRHDLGGMTAPHLCYINNALCNDHNNSKIVYTTYHRLRGITGKTLVHLSFVSQKPLHIPKTQLQPGAAN